VISQLRLLSIIPERKAARRIFARIALNEKTAYSYMRWAEAIEWAPAGKEHAFSALLRDAKTNPDFLDPAALDVLDDLGVEVCY
jgi:hypothetical protein